MKNALNSIKVESPKNNAFDLSHDVKLTCNMGELVPVLCMDVVPGDRVRISNEAMIRFLPMLAPIMHRIDVSFHTFFCPNRLVWSQWENYITNGGDDTSPVAPPAHPILTYVAPANENLPGGLVGYRRLMDFMGLPNPAVAGGVNYPETVSAIPFGIYQFIYDEYYRDENLSPKIFAGLLNGVNAGVPLYTMRNRAWEADYFTKALPFAQKGDPVTLPLAGLQDVPVRVNQGNTPGGVGLIANAFPPNPLQIAGATPSYGALPAEDLYAETSQLAAQSTTINDLRLAFRLQEWLERNARGGTRYSELIRAHFGVQSKDSRLQRPEYICGTKTPVQISEVLKTASDGATPQGEMAGHGISYTGGKPGKYFVTEHGYIMTIMSIVPKTGYMQGINKHWLKYNDPTELYWPSFANLGEQEILNREVYAFQGVPGGDTFGYQSRYMEYKSLPNRACTQMQSSLDYWNCVRKFANPPALNHAFVTSDPTTRIFAVQEDDDHLVVQVLNNIMAVRPMPVYGTPTF